jgi:hypothetical protein
VAKERKEGDEVLAERAREIAADLSLAAMWNNATEQAAKVPHTKSEVTIRDSNSTTELWKRGCADWQRPYW